jgi:hypothetical protein
VCFALGRFDVFSHGLVPCRLQIFQTWGKILAEQNFIIPEFWCGSRLSGAFVIDIM